MTFQTCSLIGTHTLFSSQFLVITMNSVGINPNYPQASGIEQIHLTYKDPCYSFSLTFTPSSLPSFP